ncbi:uncharacterized protein LOC132549837 [Ylistrum balloti]|uniref:uncharacterized protein LOC132549837 n=1 Tax=Ylistrum balloti TaxID=509963 RepID=UPI0029058F0D|nr:uncharacterized protein LOC132549837 [Ylistrum balloti]
MASQRLRPINYTVVYANTNDPGDERTKTFQARYNDNGLELNGLTPGLIYSVKYNVGYRHKTSPYSELAFKYINTQPKVEMIVGLGIGTTILLLAGILLIRKCVVWYKEIDQPIDGVEIDNNNEDHFNPKPEVRCDDSSIVSHHSDDGKYSTIPGNKNGYASVVGKSKFQNKLYQCDKLASCNGLDDFNTSFQIISSEGFGNFVSANNVRKDVEQNPDVTAARYSRAGTIDEHGQSQLESDVALNTISNEERSVEGVPRLTDSMSMIGCSHMRNSDVTLDSYELSVILFGTEGEEETDGIDDLYQREVEIPPKSVQCTDNESSSKFTDVFDEAALPGTNHQPLSGYKKIPSEEVASVIIQAENHESPAILEIENFCLTVGTDIEGHVPEVEPTQISTLDTQFSGSLFHQDGCPVVSPLPTHAVDPSDRCVGSPKAFKNHYKTLPSPNKTLDS